MSQLLVKGGTVVSGGAAVRADLLADAGKIVAIGQNLGDRAEQVIDATGMLVLPGGVDAHVHLPWPAGENISTDTIASGTRAAAFGGVTTVIDFAIPNEGQSLGDALSAKLDEARASAWVDYSFHLNIRGEVTAKLAELPDLVEAGFPSFKVFMAYAGFRLDDADLLDVMGAAARAGGMVTAHAENGPLADAITAELLAAGHRAPGCYAQARPAICEEEAIGRLLAYQRHTGVRLHVHHVSTAAGVDLIARARQTGRGVTGETCPHYLVFTDADYASGLDRAAALVCAPSIKSVADRKALWRGLATGALSVLTTDHCPYTWAQKRQGLADFSRIPGGTAGVETRLPLIYSEGVVAGRISLERFVSIWAEGPARAFGLYPRKGVLAVGSDADLVVFDPNAHWTLRAADLHMNTDCLAYEGRSVTGKAVATVLRGNLLVRAGEWLSAYIGGELVHRRL